MTGFYTYLLQLSLEGAPHPLLLVMFSKFLPLLEAAAAAHRTQVYQARPGGRRIRRIKWDGTRVRSHLNSTKVPLLAGSWSLAM